MGYYRSYYDGFDIRRPTFLRGSFLAYQRRFQRVRY